MKRKKESEKKCRMKKKEYIRKKRMEEKKTKTLGQNERGVKKVTIVRKQSKCRQKERQRNKQYMFDLRQQRKFQNKKKRKYKD